MCDFFYFLETCDHCRGSGVIGRRVTVYEHGCGFPHDDTEESPCPECDGTGTRETTVEPMTLDDLEEAWPC